MRVRIDAVLGDKPVDGRVIVSLIRSDSGLPDATEPNEGPFWERLQPMFAMDVTALRPGQAVTIADSAFRLGDSAASKLPDGKYRAQARLIANRKDSEWKRVAGNYFGPVTPLVVEHGNGTLEITLTQRTSDETWPVNFEKDRGVALCEVPSKLLSEFRGEPVTLRAGVVLPRNYDPNRHYAAVYEVPGFGGNHLGALHSHPGKEIAEDVFWIVLDPESPNGHTLFADSANNGPCGQALTQELIPALESRYPLIADAEHRLLRGHSSGGWSTVWLAISYPSVFGAAWSSSPDPVDFRRFQLSDIYSQQNMYRLNEAEAKARGWLGSDVHAGMSTPWGDVTSSGAGWVLELSSYRSFGRNTMTVLRENLGEELLGPDNVSGQQWDSWMAVFGKRNPQGHPLALFDPLTGALHHEVAETYRAYDIGERVRRDPAGVGRILRRNVRICVGGQDSFFLEEAVQMLRDDLERLVPAQPQDRGYIKILKGFDHGSIFMSPELQGFAGEMQAYLKSVGTPVSK